MPLAILFLMVFGAVGGHAMEPDDIVARVGERVIRFREIRCDRIWIKEMLHARNDSRPVDEACLDMEQARLDLVLKTELLERAVAVAGLDISDQDIAEQELPLVHDEAALSKYLEFSQAIPRAIARVRRGEDASVVYAAALAPLGIPRETFDSVSRMFDTQEKIDIYLKQDLREQTLSTLRRNARLAAVAARLVANHRAVAAGTARSASDVAAEFWKKLIAVTNTAIVAEGYRLPDPKEMP
jgi:hypothetical protein